MKLMVWKLVNCIGGQWAALALCDISVSTWSAFQSQPSAVLSRWFLFSTHGLGLRSSCKFKEFLFVKWRAPLILPNKVTRTERAWNSVVNCSNCICSCTMMEMVLRAVYLQNSPQQYQEKKKKDSRFKCSINPLCKDFSGNVSSSSIRKQKKCNQMCFHYYCCLFVVERTGIFVLNTCCCMFLSPLNYWWLFVTSINIHSSTLLAAG